MTTRVAVFMGTRPEAIKMAPVVSALRTADGLTPLVVNAGQHREMIQRVIDLFGIAVDADLEAMEPAQTLAGLTARFGRADRPHPRPLGARRRAGARRHHDRPLRRPGQLLPPHPHRPRRGRPPHRQPPLAVPRGSQPPHGEPLVDLHFAPTETARQALLAERIPDAAILVTGNTVVDALLMELRRQQEPAIHAAIERELDELLGVARRQRQLVLVTGHRRENFGAGFDQICTALDELARRMPELLIVYPVHLNPSVQDVVHARLGSRENIRLLPPQPYDKFVALAAASRLILTDSGGVQEEAPSLGKPVLVMRDTTERPEGVAAGAVKLVGPNADRIVEESLALLKDDAAYERMSKSVNPYGDGRAAPRIVARLQEFLGV